MHTTGMSFKASGRQMGNHYNVVSRLVRKHTQTNNGKDLPRSGRPRVISDRDDRALQRLVRRMSFTTSPVLKQHVASGWLSKWGTTTGCKTSLIYWSLVRLPCMVTKSSLLSWEIHPKPLLSLHRKGQLAGCSLGYRLYFCVSKPSSGRRLHEAETDSRLANGSCAMSLGLVYPMLQVPLYCPFWIVPSILSNVYSIDTIHKEKS
jgi:hypothetical protein